MKCVVGYFYRAFIILSVLLLGACHSEWHEAGEEGEEDDKYDGPGIAMQYEFDHQKDPATNRVARELLWPAIEYTEALKQDMRGQSAFSKTTLAGWVERGPDKDTVGPSNGNSRPGSFAVAAGRIRAVMVDAADPTGNTVFVGGVDGGLWKTTNITASPAGWVNINDKFSNLAITSICQDPTRPATIYFSTGESVYNADAVQGDGIFKSTDGGATFTQLSSTTSASSGGAFNYCSRILCDASGNVYVGTRSGLKRSLNGGTSWTDITPTGTSTLIADIQISSTGRLHVTAGLVFSSTAYYRFTDIPATVTSAGWTSATTPFPTSSTGRVVLACRGNTLIALPSSSSGYNVATIYQTTDGGANWAAVTSTPSFTSGQGWYCLAAAICPSNTSNYFVGSLNCYRTTNAGATAWTQVSNWVGTMLSYVHADQHNAVWYNTATQSRVIVVSDGGVHLSLDSGKTFTDRNAGLRIKQFYSCAIHPTRTNYLIGGAQDNGCHQFKVPGLSGSVEVTGGDGAFVQIDQQAPVYQFGSYVYNQYRRSTNDGVSWTSVNLSSTTGQFINPIDYDNTAKIMYCGDVSGAYRRWTNPQTGNTSAVVTVTAFNSSPVYAITVAPVTANRVYFGTANGRVVRVDSANTAASPAAGTLIGTLTANISNISFGQSEDTIIVTASTYSGTQVYYTTNATSAAPTWVAKDGNLPDMPVRWSLLVPGSGGKRVLLATETGVWYTRDITATTVTWLPDPTFPTVRTDMLKLRASDNTVAAATHGRGMWSANINDAFAVALPVNEFTLRGSAGGDNVSLNWTYQTARSAVKFDIEHSENAADFTPSGTVAAIAGKSNYTFSEGRPSGGRLYYRIKSYDAYGLTTYSNIITFAPGGLTTFDISNVYPNPAKDQLFVSVHVPVAASVRLQVYSISGSKVLDNGEQNIAGGSQVLSLGISALPPGSYLLSAVVDGKRYSYKFVKQ